MQPLPPVHLWQPTTLDEALRLLAEYRDEARPLAGGTDLLANLKHGLQRTQHLVSLRRIASLRGIERRDDRLWIGALEPLASVAAHPLVQRHAAALAEACEAVGAPQHRQMGTLGGNLCLDTRCRYYNQSAFWRGALGGCLKADGEVCHVVEQGRRCVAAAANDTAPAVVALDATVHVASADGARAVPARAFYRADGMRNTALEPGEIVVAVEVPIHPRRLSGFAKLRLRRAIDFPLANATVCLDLDESGRIEAASACVSALAARPRRLRGLDALSGRAPDDEHVAHVLAEAAWRQARPVPNVHEATEWRRMMAPVLVRRALAAALTPRDGTGE